MLIDCLLKVCFNTNFALSGAQNIPMNVFAPASGEFQVSKLFYLFEQAIKRGGQSLRGFSGVEIIWLVFPCFKSEAMEDSVKRGSSLTSDFYRDPLQP